MLNIKKIREVMLELGLAQGDLSVACDVSKEAVSNWLSGESIPRPKKLILLAKALKLEALQLVAAIDEPVIAYRTVRNRKMTGLASDAAHSVAEHLKELVSFIRKETVFSPPVLEAPSLDDSYIREVTRQVRSRIGLSPTEPLLRTQLLELLHDFGAILVPVFWSTGKHGHENALSVYLPDTKVSFVVFNLHSQIDDFNYWLAHELGHCYTLHSLQGDDGERFAERFAQELLFPREAAEIALEDIKGNTHRLERANWYAGRYETSVVTVIKQADSVAELKSQANTGLATPKFWSDWNSNRTQTPTVSQELFGIDQLTAAEYIYKTETEFRTPIFSAIAQWQIAHEGRSPAFIANALNIDVGQAYELSKCLYNPQSSSSSADSSNN